MVSEEFLEKLAREAGFLKRKSKVTVASFFDILFPCSDNKSASLTDYSIDFEKITNKTVSKQAIDKKFNEPFKQFLLDLTKSVFSKKIKRSANLKSVGNHFAQIRIMDSTEFKLPKNVAEKYPGYGGTGREAMGKIQYEFDLLTGLTTQLTIESALDSDSKAGEKNLDSIPKGSLLIRDLAYNSPKTLKNLIKKELYFISRAKSQWNFYTKVKNEYQILTTTAIIEKLKNQSSKYLDIEVFVGEKHKTPVRLIANLLTDEQAQKRKKKKSSNRKLGKDALESIGLNLFVTNVESDKCSALSIYELYRLRWQIELVFKTWKSVLNIDKFHTMNVLRIECILLLRLIWVLLNKTIFLFIQHYSNKELSFYKTAKLVSKHVTTEMLRTPIGFKQWIENVVQKHLKKLAKEYKKGSKIDDLFHLTFCK